MSSKCSICLNPKKLSMEKEILQGAAVTATARKYGVGRSALDRHKRMHMAVQIERAAKRAQLDADSLVSDLLDLREMARALFVRAAKAESWGGAASALNAAHKNVELLGKLINAFQPENVTNVAVIQGDQWPLLRDRILLALAPFDDARAAVISAIASNDAPKLDSGEVVDAESVDVIEDETMS